MSLWDDLAGSDDSSEHDRLERYVATVLDTLGSTDLSQDTVRTPMKELVIPETPTGEDPADHEWLALPSGKTVLDFRDGRVQNEHLDELVTDEISAIGELSQTFSSGNAHLRSLFLAADAPAEVKINQRTYRVAPGEPLTVRNVRYDRVQIRGLGPEKADGSGDHYQAPVSIKAVASLRSEPSAVGGRQQLRAGTDDPGTYDSYQTMEWWSPHVPTGPYSDDTILNLQDQFTTPVLWTRDHDEFTIRARLDANSGGDAEVRLVGRNAHWGSFWPIEGPVQVSPGGDVSFTVENRWTNVQLQYRNVTDGNEINLQEPQFVAGGH